MAIPPGLQRWRRVVIVNEAHGLSGFLRVERVEDRRAPQAMRDAVGIEPNNGGGRDAMPGAGAHQDYFCAAEENGGGTPDRVPDGLAGRPRRRLVMTISMNSASATALAIAAY